MRSTLRRMESDSSPMVDEEGAREDSRAEEGEEPRGDGIVAEGEGEGVEPGEAEAGSIWKSCSRIAAHSSLQRMHWRASAAFRASEAVCWAEASRFAALNTTSCNVCAASASAAADSAASASAWRLTRSFSASRRSFSADDSPRSACMNCTRTTWVEMRTRAPRSELMSRSLPANG